MTNLVQSLIKIDPTEGLVKYVNSIKPFHTKVLDVLVEYVYTEKIAVSLNDRWSWTVGLSETKKPIEHECGYGIHWDPERATIFNTPLSVINATARTTFPVTIDPSAALPFSTSSNMFIDGAAITLSTTGTLPTTTPQVYLGRQYTMVGTSTAFSLVDGYGHAITVGGVGTGVLSVELISPNVNSFLVESNLGPTFTAAATNIQTGQLTFTQPAPISMIDASLRSIATDVDLRVTPTIIGVAYDNLTVGNVAGNVILVIAGNHEDGFPASSSFKVRSPSGDITTCVVDNAISNRMPTRRVGTNTMVPISGTVQTATPLGTAVIDISYTIPPGSIIHVIDNMGDGTNGTYTVESVSASDAGTTVIVQETLSASAHNNGQLLIPSTPSTIPVWPVGMKLDVNIPGIALTSSVYYIPSAVPGVFSLSTTRYPSEYTDYVRLTTPTTLTVRKGEAYIPGATVSVSGSHLHTNDGSYLVKHCTQEGTNTRVFVLDKIKRTTPLHSLHDGVMSNQIESFSGPSYCPVSSASDMHSDAYIHESITFEYAFDLRDYTSGSVSDYSASGFGNSVYSNSTPYGEVVTSHMTSTAITPAGTMLDVGIDMQLFDVGDMNEMLHTSYKKNGGGL